MPEPAPVIAATLPVKCCMASTVRSCRDVGPAGGRRAFRAGRPCVEMQPFDSGCVCVELSEPDERFDPVGATVPA